MNNGNQEPASTDVDALLAGAETQDERDKTAVALHHFEETHPDSFAGELAVLLKSHAKSVHAAAGRIEKAVREGSPKSIAKTLEVVQKNSQDQAAALSRYPKWTFALNASSQIIIAVMGFLFGGWVVGSAWYVMHQARTKTPEYAVERAMEIIHGRIDCAASAGGRVLTIKVNPGQDWASAPPSLDKEGNAVVTLVTRH